MYNQLDVLHSAELNLKHHLEDRTQGGRETCGLKKKYRREAMEQPGGSRCKSQGVHELDMSCTGERAGQKTDVGG